MIDPEFNLEDYVKMCRGEMPIRNNTFAAAMDMALPSMAWKDMAARGQYELLDALEQAHRRTYDEWRAMVLRNQRKQRDTHIPPEMVKTAKAG